MFCWGSNGQGQLGNGTLCDQLTPTHIELPTDLCLPPIQVVGGGGISCIVDNRGVVWIAGANYKSEPTSECLRYQRLLGCPAVSMVACGWSHVLCLSKENAVFAFGDNTYGQIGLGDISSTAIAQRVELASVVQVAAGMRHSLAVDQLGQVFVWGQGRNGRVGLAQEVIRKPTLLPWTTTNAVSCVAAGDRHSLFLLCNGDIYVTGSNQRGQLNRDPAALRESIEPVRVHDFFDLPVRAISCGWSFNMILGHSGQLWSWGRHYYGQLGRQVDERHPFFQPGVVSSPTDGFDRVLCGSEHCLALSKCGRLFSWGWNEHGTCGDGSTTNLFTPTEIAVFSKGKDVCFGCGYGFSFYF